MYQIQNSLLQIPIELKFVLNCTNENNNQTSNNDRDISNLDWNRVLTLSFEHGLYPFVYNYLNTYQHHDIPDYVMNTFKHSYIKNCITTMSLSHEIARIVTYMDKNGLKPIILKGPILSARINEDIALRPSSDIDVLFDPHEFDKAEILLEQMDYKRISPDFQLTPRQRRFYIRNDHHFEYYHNKLGIVVELHWRIRSFDIKHFSAVAKIPTQRIENAGSLVHTMDDEYWLVYLMIHGYKHLWSRLRWLYDVKKIINCGNISWNLVYSIADKSEVKSILHQTLILLNIFFEVPIPDKLQESTKNDHKAWYLSETVLSSLNQTDKNEQSSLSSRIKNISYFNFNASWRNKIYHISSLLKPDEVEFKQIPLPDSLFPLYYLLKLYHYVKKSVLFLFSKQETSKSKSNHRI